MKKIFMLVALSSFLIFNTTYFQANAQTNHSEYATKSVESVSMTPQKLGSGWQLTNTFYVNKQSLMQFEKKFSAKLKALKNDVFYKDGKKLQINYIEAANSADADKVFNDMVKMVGNSNVVACKGNIIIEIINSDNELKKEIVSKIKPDKVHTNY